MKVRTTESIWPGVIISLLLCAGRAWADWDVQYDASSLVFPEASGQGWTYSNNGTGFQRGFVGNTLWVDTMPPGWAGDALGWRNTTGHFNFSTGFVMETSLKMVTATNETAEWGGADVYARSDAGYNMGIDVDPNEVILGSIFNYVSYPMNTTDAFHTYRAEAIGNQGALYVDGVLRLQLPLSADTGQRHVWFGDQGWEGGEMYFQYVRYGPLVPEPATAALLLGSAMILLNRRPAKRRGRIA
jgi:hypothetical protein